MLKNKGKDIKKGNDWVSYSSLDATRLNFIGFGPKDWGRVSPDCDKRAQSPINIETNSVIKVRNGKALKLTCANSGYVSGNIVNNGHSPTLYINKPKGTCQLSGGPLGYSKYKLEQFHFHFGCEDGEGSEHTVDGDSYSGEVHALEYLCLGVISHDSWYKNSNINDGKKLIRNS